MIEEDVKQTRCTTCDAEHAYKGGKLPRRRKKESPSALYKEVLAGHLAQDPGSVVPELEPEPDDVPAAAPAPAAPEPAPIAAAQPAEDAPVPDDEAPAESESERQVEEGPVHRPLIRAQLPRIEGQKEERRLPEFTIRQRSGNGHFRGGMKMQRPGGHAGNGNRSHGGQRFGASRPSGQGGRNQMSGRGAGGGFRSGGGRKRSR
jgi:type IV secretory pathway VirB10-like protein